MKILMTGLTAKHAGRYSAGTLRYCTAAPINADALRAMGHEVDWRFVTPGEDTTGYDVLWINIQPANSLAARVEAAPGALWCLAQRQPTVIWTDDWAVSALWPGFRLVGKRLEQQCNKIPDGKYWYLMEPCKIAPYYDQMSQAMLDFSNLWTAERPWIMASPMFQWGNRDLFFHKGICVPRDRWLSVDPSSAMLSDPVFAYRHNRERSRAWAIATLINHQKWLDRNNFTWPVKIYSSNRPWRRTGKATMLRGDDKVMDAYAQNQGALAPPYYHAGSGWWRARYPMLAQAGVVTYCEPDDGRVIGDPYVNKLSDLETMSDACLEVVAASQGYCLRSQFATLAEYHQQLTDVLELACQKG